MSALKPKPKYGWWGQSGSDDEISDEITIGSRVYHCNAPKKIGTIIGAKLILGNIECWVIEWDAYPGQRYDHTRDTIRKC